MIQQTQTKAEYDAVYGFNKRKQLRAVGLCIHCGKKPARAGRQMCGACAAINRSTSMAGYRKMKDRSVAYLGCRCSVCGLQDDIPSVYDFHHVNPKTKTESITKMLTRRATWEEIRAELDKCVPVCANCHRRIESPSHRDGDCGV